MKNLCQKSWKTSALLGAQRIVVLGTRYYLCMRMTGLGLVTGDWWLTGLVGSHHVVVMCSSYQRVWETGRMMGLVEHIHCIAIKGSQE